ncbi:DUF4278 domain-containing protein [Synechococcus sp. GreenBA-s]|nr:DUF4278 domain-containing protein [Synechococcus sp. GreenBA-s]
MSTTTLRYRGVAYDPAARQHPQAASAQPVDHVYRGHHYSASLQHAAQAVDPALELHYRGSVYHHRLAEAAAAVRHSEQEHVAL